MSSITIGIVFTKDGGDPATGLTLSDIAIYLKSRLKSDGAVATVWNGVAPTEEVGGGIYTRTYASADEATYEYFGWAVYGGAETLDSNYALQLSPEFSAAAVWGHDTRTLTQSAASVAAAVAGSDITIHRGDTVTITVTGLGDISGRTKLWFTVKVKKHQPDAEAIIQIEETAGMIYVNGAAAAVSDRSTFTVDDEAAGDVTIVLDGADTVDLEPRPDMYYDFQYLTADGDPITKSPGSCDITADVTRAIA